MDALPLSTLLSQVLVAFTIEFDNEAERQIPHRTTRHAAATGTTVADHGPWLVSMVMYLNCMRFVDDDGITVRKLEELARSHTNLPGMERWRYITVEKASPRKAEWVLRPTAKGRMAQEIWRSLFAVIEKRWEDRFGDEVLDPLRESLRALVARLDPELPDCLPILGYGLFCAGPQGGAHAPVESVDENLSLPSLLSRALLAFALEFEGLSEVSLAISANVLRVLDEKGVRVRDIPLVSGVSKESISMAIGILQKKSMAVLESKGKVRFARLTDSGRDAQGAYLRFLEGVEEAWRERFGEDTIGKLRKPLEQLVGEPTAQASPLFKGLKPSPGNWRASVRAPNTLPHFPMVLHRGGYPDGS